MRHRLLAATESGWIGVPDRQELDMPEDPMNRDLEDLEGQASVDEAITQELAHEERRDADAKQGGIERETRAHHLDEG